MQFVGREREYKRDWMRQRNATNPEAQRAATNRWRAGKGLPPLAEICVECDGDLPKFKNKYCSRSCLKRAERRREAAKDRIPKNPIKALGIDFASIDDIRRATDEDVATGCWNWQGVINQGYPKFGHLAIHRRMAELRYGDLDGQAVHHACANTHCVNPQHLQPVSHRENTAEMLQRNYFLDRIRRLEEALAEWAPLHPLLNTAAEA